MRSISSKNFKRTLSFVLTVLMFFGMLPANMISAKAASSIIHIYRQGDPVNYLGLSVPVKVYDSNERVFAAYSLNHTMNGNDDGDDYSYDHSEKDDYGYSYILSHGLISDSTWLGEEEFSEKSFAVKYYMTQMAILAYSGQVDVNWSSDPENIGDAVTRLVSGAKNATDENKIIAMPDTSISILQASTGKNAVDHDMFEVNGYYRTQLLKLKGDGEFSLSLSSTANNKIDNVTNKLERVGDPDGEFYYRIKAEDITGVLNVKLTATAEKSVPYYYGKYYLNSDGIQPMLIPEKDEKTVTASDYIIINLDRIKVTIDKTSEVVNPTTGVSSYEPAAGIKFKLTGTETYYGETDETGKLVLDKLPYGNYTVTELNVPSYYYTPQIEKIKGIPGQSYNIQVKNVLKRGMVQVQARIEPEKYARYETLAGFTFRLTGTADCGHTYNLTAVTNDKGIATFTDETGSQNLLIGTYTITQVLGSNQQRFYPKTETQSVTVKEDQLVTKEFISVIKTGGLEVQKVSEDGFVENIGFNLYGESLAYKETGLDIYKYSKPDTVSRTDASGIAKFTDILIGEYDIEEVYPDDGRKLYKYIKPDIQSVLINWNSKTDATVNNVLKRGTVSVKLWSEDGILAGRTFRLTGMSFAKIPVDERVTTDSNGVATFKNILISGEPGDDNYYTLTEESVPERYYVQGYRINTADSDVTLIKNETKNPIKVQVTYNDAQNEGYTTYTKFFNLLKRGDIRLTLRAEDDLPLDRKFRLTYTSLAYEQTSLDKITAGTIKDTSMDSQSMHRYGDLQLRNGTEALKGTYEMTTKASSLGTTVVDGVTWKTAEVVFKDIPISGNTDYVIEEVSTPTRYIEPYSQTITVKNQEITEVKFYNELKRGSIEITKTAEDGFIEGMTFKLTGTSLAYRQTNGAASKTVYGEELGSFTYTATTNKNGVAIFENLLITTDGAMGSSAKENQYKIEEINTKTRYIQPDSQYTDVVWNNARLYREGGPGPGSEERWTNKATLSYYNQLKRGDLKVTVSTEDGYLQGFKFRLTGTCFAERQTGENGETQTGDCVPPKGETKYTNKHEELYKIDFTATTDSTGTAVFKNILISHDEATSDSTWYYQITPVDTPRRYEIAEDQAAPIYWSSTSGYKPEVRSFYNKLKRGTLIIKKTVETVDEATRKPTETGAKLSDYRFRITAKSLASYETGTTTPPAYKNIYGGNSYETVYETTTNSNGYAIFSNILINDYMYSDKGNYIDYTHDLSELPEDPTSAELSRYYYEIEEINLSDDFMQPDKQYANVKWINDVPLSERNNPNVEFANKLKTFRVIMEKQDIETGTYAQGDALLTGGTYCFYYNGTRLSDYNTMLGKDLKAADATLNGYVEDNRAYLVTDYYVCGDGYAIQEKKKTDETGGNTQTTKNDNYNGYLINEKVIYISANSSRFKTSNRYDRNLEKTEYTIVGNPDGTRYIAKNQVIKKTVTLVKTVRPGDEYAGVPEYCVEFKVYLESKGFRWDATTMSPALTYLDPYLNYVNPSVSNPHDYDMTDDATIAKIEQWQKDVRNLVINASEVPSYPNQDYIITNASGIRKSIVLPYGNYVVEQVTSWNSYEIAKVAEVSLTVNDVDNDNNVYLYLRNIIDKQKIKIVVLDSEIDANKYPNEEDRRIAKAGFKFKLWDTIKEEYVPIKTYPQTEYIMETNEMGEASTYDEIESGIYQIHQIDSATGFARAQWENGDYERLHIGYDENCFNPDDGTLLDYVTVYVTNCPQKTVLKIYNQGEKMYSVNQTVDSGTTVYSPVYKTMGLAGTEFQVFAVTSPTDFDDIPENMKQYAKPITASNSTDPDMCYSRYFDRFGSDLQTTVEPIAPVDYDGFDNKGNVLVSGRTGTSTTGSDGWTTVGQLYNGLYRIVQSKAADGMLLNTTATYVYINNVDKEQRVVERSVTVNNNRQKSKFTVDKKMEQIKNYNIGFSGEVTGVTFGIYARRTVRSTSGATIPAGSLLGKVTMKNTDIYNGLGSGTFDVDLPEGQYYIKEINTHAAYVIDTRSFNVAFDYYPNAVAGKGYTTDDGIEYKVDANGCIEIKPTNPDKAERDTTLYNKAKRGVVKGYKVQQGDTNVKINGALFGLFAPGTTDFSKENALATCYSANGGYFEFTDIPYGKWILKELEQPEGYLLTNMSTQNPNIEENEQQISYDIENELIRGTIYLKKYDKVSAQTIINHTSSKAQFILYKDTNGNGQHDTGEPVYEQNNGRFTTDDNGDLYIRNVPYGDYVLMESAAPNGYLIDNGGYSVRIRENGATYQITNTSVEDLYKLGNVFVNDRKLGTLKITKTAELLDNVVQPDGTIAQTMDVDNIMFTITSLANQNPFNVEFTFTAVTDENGIAIFKDVPVGYYTIVEVKTNANKIYNLKDNEGTVEIEYNKQTEKTVNNITYKNKLVIVKYAPDCGDFADIRDIRFKITGIVNENNKIEQYVTINQNVEAYGDYGRKSVTTVELVVGNYSIEEIVNEEIFVKPENQIAVLSDMSMSYDDSLKAYQNKDNSSYNADYPQTTVTFTNYLKIITNLRVTKTGEDPDTFTNDVYTENTADRKPLSGVSFLVTGDPYSDYDEVKNFSTVITTSMDGTAAINRLHVGKYTVTELHPYTYRLTFTGKYDVDGTTGKRVFTDYIAPVTEQSSTIKARLRTQLVSQGAEDIEAIIDNILAMIDVMMIDGNMELTGRYGDSEIFLERVGSDGNIGYVVDSTPKEYELKYMGPNYYWEKTYTNNLETAQIQIKKTSEDDYPEGTVFYVEGYSTTGVHCSYYFTADQIAKEFDASTGRMKNVASTTQRILTGVYNVKEISKTQYDLSSLTEESFNEDGTIKAEIEKQPVDITSEESIYIEPAEQNGIELNYSYFNENTLGKATFYNKLKRGDLKISLSAEDRIVGNLKGFVFKVTGISANGDTYSKYFTTDENGEILVKDLVVGEYKVEQQLYSEDGNKLTIMDPYILPELQNTTISFEQESELSFYDKLERGPLEIIKDSVDGKVEGVQFRVEGWQKNNVWFEGIFITDADGRVYTDIIAGEYLVTELFPDKSPYKSQEQIKILVDKNGYAQVIVPDDETGAATSTDATPTEPEENKVACFYNAFAYGSVQVILTASDNNVAGFSFNLSGTAYNGEKINITLTTDAYGIVRFPNIPIGEFTIQEVKNDKTIPYVLPAAQSIKVEEDENVIANFFNKLITGTVKVLSVGSDKKKLADSVYTIYDLDRKTVRGTIVTGSNGSGTLTGLVYGEYYIRQTDVRTGYQLNKNYAKITIHKDGVVCSFTYINKKYKNRSFDDIVYTGYTNEELKQEQDSTVNNTEISAKPITTGDATNATIYLIIMLFALATAVISLSKKKRNQH